METKLERIADKSAHEPKPEFTSLYHLINKELLMQCHRELDGSKAVGIDEVTKKEYGENLEQNIKDTHLPPCHRTSWDSMGGKLLNFLKNVQF